MRARERGGPDLTIWHDDGRKVVIVGQAPSRGLDGVCPFSGRSGRRLEELAGLPQGGIPERFASVNLLPRWPGRSSGKGDKFPLDKARKAAQRLREVLPGRRVLAVGWNVSSVLDPGEWGRRPILSWHEVPPFSAFAIIPHPSGVVLWWNELENRMRAADFMRSLCAA